MKTSPSQRCLTGCLLVFTLLYPFWLSAQQESMIQQGVKTADSVKYYVSSGQKLAAERKFEEALIAYEKARKFDNKNEEAILGQMEVNFQLRRVNEGLKIIEEWTKIDPENVNAWKNMAGFFSMTGQDEVALNAL